METFDKCGEKYTKTIFQTNLKFYFHVCFRFHKFRCYSNRDKVNDSSMDYRRKCCVEGKPYVHSQRWMNTCFSSRSAILLLVRIRAVNHILYCFSFYFLLNFLSWRFFSNFCFVFGFSDLNFEDWWLGVFRCNFLLFCISLSLSFLAYIYSTP